MDKLKLRTLASDIEIALKAVGIKHGVTITRGSGTYMQTTASLKLNIVDLNENGEVMNVAREDFKTMCKIYGISPDWLDANVFLGGTEFTVSGLNTRNPKNLIQLTRKSDGKLFKCSGPALKTAMGRVQFPNPAGWTHTS